MRDPRALANSKNLESYRAWTREGYRRSGFIAIVVMIPLLLPFFTSVVALIEHAAKGGRATVAWVGGSLAVYLAICLGLAVFGALRLNAWKRAHPWAPPS
jgi:hypothetical protein